MTVSSENESREPHPPKGGSSKGIFHWAGEMMKAEHSYSVPDLGQSGKRGGQGGVKVSWREKYNSKF